MTKTLVRCAVLALLSLTSPLLSGGAWADTITVRVVNLKGTPIQDVINPATGTPLFAGIPVNLTVSNVADRANPVTVRTLSNINTHGESVNIDPAVREIQLVFDDGNGARFLKSATLVGIANTTQTITVVMPEQNGLTYLPMYYFSYPVYCSYPAKHSHRGFRYRHN